MKEIRRIDIHIDEATNWRKYTLGEPSISDVSTEDEESQIPTVSSIEVADLSSL